MSIVIRNMRTATELMIYFLISVLITGLLPMVSNGQSINSLRKLWQNDALKYLPENQKEKLLTDADFHQYARIRDDEFGEYLREPWCDFEIRDGLSDESLAPLNKQPVFNNADVDTNPPVNLPISAVKGLNNRRSGAIKWIPVIRKPESDAFTSAKATFLFYGQPISISYDKLITVTKIKSVSEDSISVFWSSFARSNSNHLIDQLMDYRDLRGLGDWGYFQLVKAASGHIFRNDQLNTDLLTWALMIRSGFDVRMAFNQSSTTLLFPSAGIIYNKQFVVIGLQRFYLDRELKSQLLLTCEQPFRDTFGVIDLKFHMSLNFNGKLTARKFVFAWNNKNYVFTLHFSPEVIRFYTNYPQTDPSVYFGAPLTSILKEDLLNQLHPIVSKMDEDEAVAFLQQFVQGAFSYTPLSQNSEVFKIRFAEQAIASKSGDDQSKAVLFSWLIRIVARLPVVGVQFPGYFSTAIGFNKPAEGDFYLWNRKKYYIVDPTFLNAPVGVIMPEFSGIAAQLIALENADSQSEKAHKIWNQVLNLGALRGGTGQDIVFDRHGRAFITGYFKNNGSYVPFIACFSQWNSLQWIRKFEGDAKAIAFAVTQVNDDEIYIAGTFEGELTMNGRSLYSAINADLFIAQFNQNGELVWMKSVGIDPAVQENRLSYVVKFDRPGNNISIQFSNENERNLRTGFGPVSETGLCFIGSGISTPGYVPYSWTEASTDIPGSIYKEYFRMVKNKYQPTTAGILALIKLLQNQGAHIKGSQIQTSLTRYNPSFQANHPLFFSAVGRIDKLITDNGVVTLRIVGDKPITLTNLMIDDGARFYLRSFGNGDISVGIISGVRKIIKAAVLPVNSLLIDCSSGNLIVDYDYDHTLKTIPVTVLNSLQ